MGWNPLLIREERPVLMTPQDSVKSTHQRHFAHVGVCRHAVAKRKRLRPFSCARQGGKLFVEKKFEEGGTSRGALREAHWKLKISKETNKPKKYFETPNREMETQTKILKYEILNKQTGKRTARQASRYNNWRINARMHILGCILMQRVHGSERQCGRDTVALGVHHANPVVCVGNNLRWSPRCGGQCKICQRVLWWQHGGITN